MVKSLRIGLVKSRLAGKISGSSQVKCQVSGGKI